MALHSDQVYTIIDFQNIAENDQDAMGKSIYYAFYKNYSAYYCTHEETDDVPNTFIINDLFIRCFLGSGKARGIALANMPLHKPYAKKLVVECSLQNYTDFVSSCGINYLLDLLRILDNVNHLKLIGCNHRNAGIFLPLLKRTSTTKNIATLEIDFEESERTRRSNHLEYSASMVFFQCLLRSFLDCIENIVISCPSWYWTNQLLELFELSEEATEPLPLKSLTFRCSDYDFINVILPIGPVGFWQAINQPRLSNLMHLGISAATDEIAIMRAHQALSDNTNITSISISDFGDDALTLRHREVMSLWVDRLLDLFSLQTNSVHSLTIQVLSQPSDRFYEKVLRFAQLTKTRKIILTCKYRDESGKYWRGLDQVLGGALLEAVKRNRRLEVVGIPVFDRNIRENIEMYSYMNKLGFEDALIGGDVVTPVIERSYRFIRKLFDNQTGSMGDDGSSNDDDSSNDNDLSTDDINIIKNGSRSLALDSTFTFLKMNSILFERLKTQE